MERRQKIRDLIENNLAILDDTALFSDDDNFFALGFVNSLFAMKLINYIEREFNIAIDNDELDINNFSSINKIFDFMDKKTVAGGVHD